MTNLAIHELTDRKAREDALDTSSSILLQAPAGSGKTELLAMRFLKLLAEVEEPEQVLGITFTKAATAEIRHRIVGKLEKARTYLETGVAPEDEVPGSLDIVTAAYTNSIGRGWRLLEQPNRLDIQTIDSLSLRIAHQMPLSGKAGGTLQPTEEAAPLYKKAARRTFDRLGGDDEELNHALRALLLLRDSHLAGCETLLAKMLATRDQWTRAFPLTGEIEWPAVRQRLEEPFRREIDRVLGTMHALLSSHPELTRKLLRLADFACRNNEEAKVEIRLLEGLTTLPSPSPEFVDHWRCFAEFLLTNEDEPRKAYNVNHGFPPGASEKTEMLELVQDLSEILGFVDLLAEIRVLPPPGYTEKQWVSLHHIFIALRQAVAELTAVFVEQGSVDFIEIGMAALQVLRDDTRGRGIQHLLVDEFQDTSRTQHELIAALLRGWNADTATEHRRTLFDTPRTLFLVGDPMQSIYMFRQADVELFAQVRDQGFSTGASEISTTPLSLKTNFRSHAGLVGPLNAMFETVFPHEVKHGSAEVMFLSATPKDVAAPGAYRVHADFMTSEKSSRDEAQRRETEEILKIIRGHQPRMDEARDRGKEFTVAILARAKNHLVPLAAALRDAGLPFRAVDLEELGERQEVLDLQSLARALLHPMDRIAWLGLLRAPWCGLELHDLHLLCGTDDCQSNSTAVPAQIEERLHLLRDDPKERVGRVIAILQAALANRHRQSSFSSWIERTWNSLGGPACVDAAGYENAQAFFRMLEDISPDGIDATGEAMQERLARLHAESDPAVSDRRGVQLMTMHKAKGLGFNVVVLPGLEKIGGKDSPDLIRYLERSTEKGTELLVAPIGSKGDKSSSIYSWVWRQKQNREAEERKRLLYVACTRAREELHLFATATVTKAGVGSKSGSLLSTAWPALHEHFEKRREEAASAGSSGSVVNFPSSLFQDLPFGGVLDSVAAERHGTILRRLPSDWSPVPIANNVAWSAQKTAVTLVESHDETQRPRGSRASRILGTIVHALFERAALLFEQGASDGGLRVRLPAFRDQAYALARNEGLSAQEANTIAGTAVQALEKAMADPVGLWILAPHHEARTESSWTGIIDGAPRTLRIDRSFWAGPEPLSEGTDSLWVVDYKTATHGLSGIEEFLDAEKQLYVEQLESYAAIMRMLHGAHTQVRLGLYYPLLPRLIWWLA